MNTPKKNILEKEKFMDGTRQKWTAILLLYSFVILATQIFYQIDPEPYMSFAVTIGSLFILGGSVDSFLRIQTARSIKEKQIETPPVSVDDPNQ
jgi:hypothetical protein